MGEHTQINSSDLAICSTGRELEQFRRVVRHAGIKGGIIWMENFFIERSKLRTKIAGLNAAKKPTIQLILPKGNQEQNVAKALSARYAQALQYQAIKTFFLKLLEMNVRGEIEPGWVQFDVRGVLRSAAEEVGASHADADRVIGANHLIWMLPEVAKMLKNVIDS